jgi:signal transduction histidine kinase
VLDTVCTGLADLGHATHLHGARHVIATGYPLQIKRALTNLIQNAVRHGGNADVSVPPGRIAMAASASASPLPTV